MTSWTFLQDLSGVLLLCDNAYILYLQQCSVVSVALYGAEGCYKGCCAKTMYSQECINQDYSKPLSSMNLGSRGTNPYAWTRFYPISYPAKSMRLCDSEQTLSVALMLYSNLWRSYVAHIKLLFRGILTQTPPTQSHHLSYMCHFISTMKSLHAKD